MSRKLSGLELQGFIKERQARQVRNLRQSDGIIPKLRIIMSQRASEVIRAYVRMKKRYADDILIDVEVEMAAQSELAAAIRRANDDPLVQGIILQLPIDDPAATEELCNLIAPHKDVDGLGAAAEFPSATAQAIDWLLAGYNVNLAGKKIAIVGQGKLAGAPLAHIWRERGLDVAAFDEMTPLENMNTFDVIITATGVPGLITSDMVKPKAVVVDAGTASEHGKIVGDVAAEVRQRRDIAITPEKGGVGPLTYVVLFDHLIEACLRLAGKL